MSSASDDLEARQQHVGKEALAKAAAVLPEL
jgi:hypothetical protein